MTEWRAVTVSPDCKNSKSYDPNNCWTWRERSGRKELVRQIIVINAGMKETDCNEIIATIDVRKKW